VTLIVAFTLLGVGLTRLLRSPRGAWRHVAVAGMAAALATQLLPEGHPLRTDVAQSSRNLGWIALGLVPVAIYAFALQRLRRRTGVARAAPQARDEDGPSLRGLVQIIDDAALASETEAALGRDVARALGDVPRTRSLGWRNDDGALGGHLKLVVLGETCEILLLRVADAQRRAGTGTALMRGAEDLSREMGARQIILRAGSWQDQGFLSRAGYRPVCEHEIGPGFYWVWLQKDLT
jgi:GNAT superfamily N-acetyltransferase